ncbi:cation diffusion facilitator 10 [Sporormia fimetaria CBS 119925]|uniref:Cation diffusion facilitator 10 n=1 Tax=Sporormia fimetaria CBS 119925 TaxID=1340428 RepID=A0A6A6VHV1_9PLEO|nr:cation diffusion facilitator 10 [Sporormia fimetaria CBS 119925]
MDDSLDSPERKTHPSIPAFMGWLPLSAADTSALSTRGQNLPALITRNNRSQSRQRHGRRGSITVASLSRENSQRRDDTQHRPNSERRGSTSSDEDDWDFSRGGFTMPWGMDSERRMSNAAEILNTPQMRSQRLIGNSNPRYRWERYYKTDEELTQMKKPIRKYYERNNYLIQHYLYIDRLLDSSLPHSLIQEYSHMESGKVNIPQTISEEPRTPGAETPNPILNGNGSLPNGSGTLGSAGSSQVKLKRTPKNLYKVPEPSETTPLMASDEDDLEAGKVNLPEWEPEEDFDTQSPIVKWAIYVNMAANTALLILKIIVTIMTSSLSVIASLVDAALDFLSTAIVWFTAWMIARQNKYNYPVGRRRLEPIGVLVFSVIMITSFFQVAIEGFSRLTGGNHTVVQLSVPAVAIMSSTVLIKFACWLWCRMIRNSSVQALAQDAMTDVVFNIFSIIFPLVGYYFHIWYLDPLGGLLLSAYVIINWSRTSATHIRNLTGAAASADERNILLYTTMRFAKTIKQIQGINAYHAGDKLNVEVDIVVDENTALRDSHDLGESLQYVLESVPYVDRAFVHIDYTGYNLPSHMSQQE